MQETIDITRQTCEAYKSCTPILELAREHGVEMPITEQVVNVLHHDHSPTVMAAAFMAHPSRIRPRTLTGRESTSVYRVREVSP